MASDDCDDGLDSTDSPPLVIDDTLSEIGLGEDCCANALSPGSFSDGMFISRSSSRASMGSPLLPISLPASPQLSPVQSPSPGLLPSPPSEKRIYSKACLLAYAPRNGPLDDIGARFSKMGLSSTTLLVLSVLYRNRSIMPRDIDMPIIGHAAMDALSALYREYFVGIGLHHCSPHSSMGITLNLINRVIVTLHGAQYHPTRLDPADIKYIYSLQVYISRNIQKMYAMFPEPPVRILIEYIIACLDTIVSYHLAKTRT